MTLQDGRKRLKSALDAELLLANILGIDRTALLASNSAFLSELEPGTARRYEEALRKRESGFSVAAITGRKEFRYIELLVDEYVLIPRPETETLVEAALSWIKTDNKGGVQSGLDICTGSGAVAFALLDETESFKMYACDIDDKALAIARKNSQLMPHLPINILKSDLFEAFPDRKFDLVTANPPYIPSAQIETLAKEVQNEPHIALDGGVDGLDIIRRILNEAPHHLCDGGALFMEAAPNQIDGIAELAKESGLNILGVYYDLAGCARVIGAAMP